MLLQFKLNRIAMAILVASPILIHALEANAIEQEKAGQAPTAVFKQFEKLKQLESNPENKEEKKTAKAPEEVKAEASPESVVALGNTEVTLGAKEISGYIPRFYLRKNTSESGTHLKAYGLIKRKCAKHLRIEIDQPIIASSDDERSQPYYSLRFIRSDLAYGDRIEKAKDNCPAKENASCRVGDSSCVDIHEVAGLIGLENTALDVDGKVKIQTYDPTFTSKEIPNAVRSADLPRAFGGPIEFKTPETLAAEESARSKRQRNEILLAACKAAAKGNREEIENLSELLGPQGIEKHEKLINSLKDNADNLDMKALEKQVAKAKTLTALESYIDDADKFYQDHPNMKGRVLKLLIEGIARKAIEMESSSNKDTYRQMKVAERALTVAKQIDPQNPGIRKALAIAKLERFKWSASTGDDAFYDSVTRKEAENAYRNVQNWASHSSDREVRKIAADYQRAMVERPIGIPGPNGVASTAFLGTGLEDTFVHRSIEEEMLRYRRDMMSDLSSGSFYRMPGR